MVKSKAILPPAPVTNSQETSPRVAKVAVKLPKMTEPKKGVEVRENFTPSHRKSSPSETNCCTLKIEEKALELINRVVSFMFQIHCTSYTCLEFPAES